MNVKLKLLVRTNQNRGLYVLVFNLLPSILAFISLLKDFILFEQLSDKWHDWSKFFDETPIKLGHPIENLNLLWGSRYWHVY
jgi:hypothetical protein